MQRKNICKALVMTALLLGLTACAGGNSVEERVARANRFIADSDYPAAIIELKNALQADSQSAEARYLLGEVYLQSGDWLSARKELQRAKELGWSDSAVQPALARALLALGENAQVREIDAKSLTPEAEARVLAAQAAAALNQGDSWEAQGLIDKALARAPDSSEVQLASARIQAGQGDFEAALATLEQLRARDPGLTETLSLRGDILARQKDYQGALAAYDQAIEANPDNYNDRYKRAVLNLQLGNYEAAQIDATALLDRAPQHPGTNYIQGLLHFQAGRYEAAITALSVTEPAYKQYPAALFFLGSAQLLQGNLDLAASHAGRFHNLQPDSVRGRKLLATVRLQQGRFSAVEALLQPVLDADPQDVDALNLAANAMLGQGRTDEGIDLLSRVAALQPDSPVAQVRLGAGLLMGEQEGDAARHIETALELDPEFQQAEILLVLNYLNKEDYPAAIAAAQAYQQRHLTNVRPYALLGNVYLKAGQPDEARAAFEQALALDAADPAANHSLARMALADDDIATARKYYENVLAAHPKSVSTLIQLAELDARQGDENAMLNHLELATAADQTALQPRLLLGRYYLAKGRPEQVAPLFTNLPTSQQQAPEVLQLMAIAQLSSKDKAGAQFTLEKLLTATPDSAAIRYMMAMASAGNDKRTRQELERALALDENHVPARIALAKLDFASQSMTEVEQHLEKLQSLAPENPNVMLLQASLEQQHGNGAAALALANKAFDTAPSSSTLIVLASYLDAAGDGESAHQRYAAWLEENPDDIAVRTAFANSLQLGGHHAEAGAQYTIIIKADPDNVVVLNNLAWILRDQDPALALRYARRSASLAPDSPEVLDTLAVVEYVNKDYQRAQRSIQRALRARPDHPTMLYHSAMIAAALDDKEGARITLEKLLATNKTFPEAAEAQALLANLGN